MRHNKTMSGGAFEELQAGEALKLKSYRDGGGVWTIGWGHTGPDVTAGMTITRNQAVSFLEHDLTAAFASIDKLVRVELTQGQFDAVTDFVFNLGAGQLQNSTLLKRLNAGDYVGASQELVRWVYDNGKLYNGLAKRRGREFIRWYS